MFDYETRLAAIAGHTLVCVGDVMLDRYVYGDVTRISPEAPAPVLVVRREETAPGGAANVALNVAGLGARAVVIGVVGDDDAGKQLILPFTRSGGQLEAQFVIDPDRPTTQKTRFVSAHHSTHMLRADWEDDRPLAEREAKDIVENARRAIARAGALILSDYGKGVLAPATIEALIAAARQAKKPVVVDPKGSDYSIYRGATVITPNRAELSRAVGREVKSADEVAAAATELAERCGVDAILVTRSEDGMTLVVRGRPPVHIPAHPVRLRDVSGAGDTVVAAVAALLAIGADLEAAARTANAAAAVVIAKQGTAAVTLPEIRAVLVPHAAHAHEHKIARNLGALDECLATWRRAGYRIGFTNGVFDILHPGHLKVLAEARAACDRLIVGLNSDASTRRLKGPSRPVQDEVARSQVLAGLESVDLVVLFEEDTPLELIGRVKPQVLIKGGDYKPDQVIGREIVEAAGGEVILVEPVPERSTTRIVERTKKQG
jgi:D-beta-D-heptose 7-phosphate kinase / D-beta-D-heptose 1-phosphate adenosyltransferase